jgi:hypothetical protein
LTDLGTWRAHAKPGERVTYHTGFLADDRMMPCLVQRRIEGRHRFEYVAVACAVPPRLDYTAQAAEFAVMNYKAKKRAEGVAL